MDTKIVLETSQRSLAGTLSFPKAVQTLISTGVEYYGAGAIGNQERHQLGNLIGEGRAA